MTTDPSTLSSQELAALLYAATERERRWAEVARLPSPRTIGAVRSAQAIQPVSPMTPIPLERLRRLAIELAPMGVEPVARGLLELAVESGTDIDGATKAITAGLRQARRPRRRRRAA